MDLLQLLTGNSEEAGVRFPRKPRKFAGFSRIIDSGDAKAPMLPEHLLTRNGKLTTQVPRTNAHPRTESMRAEVDLGKLAAVHRKWRGHPDET